jgi:hypothetical protein
MAEYASEPVIYNIECADDDTEYSQQLPNGTKYFEFQNQAANTIRWAFDTGAVAAGADAYMTLKANDAYSSYIPLWGAATLTLYVAHTAGSSQTVELICWR